MFGDTTNLPGALSVSLVYPRAYTDEKILEAMQQVFMRLSLGDEYVGVPAEEALATYAEKYIAAYKEREKDFDKEAGISAYVCEEQLTNTIEFNKGGFLSLTTVKWDYTGGAHGLGLTQASVIDLSTGNLLKEEDIFDPQAKDSLSAVIVKNLADAYNLSSPEELKAEGFSDTIAPNGNFFINEDGVTYIYNPYDIAAYVMGTIRVFIPYADLAGCMKENSPVAKIIK